MAHCYGVTSHAVLDAHTARARPPSDTGSRMPPAPARRLTRRAAAALPAAARAAFLLDAGRDAALLAAAPGLAAHLARSALKVCLFFDEIICRTGS